MTRQELIQLIANLESASYSLGFNVADSNNGLDELIKAEAEAEEALVSAIDAIKNPSSETANEASQGREHKPGLRIVRAINADITQTQTQMTDKQLLDNFDLIGTKKYISTQCQSEIDRLNALLKWVNYGEK